MTYTIPFCAHRRMLSHGRKSPAYGRAVLFRTLTHVLYTKFRQKSREKKKECAAAAGCKVKAAKGAAAAVCKVKAAVCKAKVTQGAAAAVCKIKAAQGEFALHGHGKDQMEKVLRRYSLDRRAASSSLIPP